MNAAMTNFEDRFFNQLDKRFDSIEAKLDKNTSLTQQVKNQAEQTNGRVLALEKRVFKKKNAFALLQDRQLIGLFVFALVLFLLILANIMGVKVPSL